jgi:hypothetical protein
VAFVGAILITSVVIVEPEVEHKYLELTDCSTNPILKPRYPCEFVVGEIFDPRWRIVD